MIGICFQKIVWQIICMIESIVTRELCRAQRVLSKHERSSRNFQNLICPTCFNQSKGFKVTHLFILRSVEADSWVRFCWMCSSVQLCPVQTPNTETWPPDLRRKAPFVSRLYKVLRWLSAYPGNNRWVCAVTKRVGGTSESHIRSSLCFTMCKPQAVN